MVSHTGLRSLPKLVRDKLFKEGGMVTEIKFNIILEHNIVRCERGKLYAIKTVPFSVKNTRLAISSAKSE